MVHYDVVVSGCGPTGGILANLLADKGIVVLVIDIYPEVYPMPRAIVLDWEVMRALQAAGVADELYPTTKPHPGTDFLGLDGQVIKIFDPVPPPHDLGWPPTLTFIQPELESMLRRVLDGRATATQKFGTELTGFEDRGDKVHVMLCDTESGEETAVTCDYLIGCDGANSLIRTTLDLPIDDLGFDEWWVVVDAFQQRDTPLPPKTTQYCWPSRPATYVVGPRNVKRWELKLLPGEKPEDFNDPEVLKVAMRPYVDTDAFEIWRHAAYRFRSRVGGQWSMGRINLAGDAAHQTPPFLAQGLCAGIRDAFNIAWKLVQIKSHGADSKLLDSYEEERRPHVYEIIAHAKEFGLIIGEMDVERARKRDAELGALLVSGKMVTTRQSFIPDLRGGVLAKDDETELAGKQMVQPRVSDGKGREALLDDFAPMQFLYLTDGTEAQGWLKGFEEKFAALGGARIAIVADGSLEETGRPTFATLRDTGDVFARWKEHTGCSAVLVRPDRYIYSGLENATDLAAKLNELTVGLGRYRCRIR